MIDVKYITPYNSCDIKS